MATSGMKNVVDVLLVGLDMDDVKCRTFNGGIIFNLKMVKDLASVDPFLMYSFDLIVLDEKVGTEIVKALKAQGVKSMMVFASSSVNHDQCRQWTKAGADEFFVKPLNDENMRSLFNQLKTGIENGSFKKPFKILIVDAGSFHVDRKDLFKKTGVAISLRSGADEEVASDVIKCGISFDTIFLTKASMVKEFRDKGLDSMIVGVTSSPKERLDFIVAEVNQFVSPPLTMAHIHPIIEPFLHAEVMK